LLAYAPLVVWIALILFFSGPRGSVEQTAGFFELVMQFLFPTYVPDDYLHYYTDVRKILHFVVYAVLGFLAFRAFTSLWTRLGFGAALAAFWLSVAVALTDEFLQSLDNSRTGTLFDVAIDMAGALFAITVAWLVSAGSSWTKKV
jgi:VanZ family protein